MYNNNNDNDDVVSYANTTTGYALIKCMVVDNSDKIQLSATYGWIHYDHVGPLIGFAKILL